MKKNQFIIITTLFLFLIANTQIFAKENIVDDLMNSVTKKEASMEEIGDSEPIVTNQYFDIKLIRGGQSAFTRKVTYTVEITPHLDSPKTQILWNAPATLEIAPKHKEFISMNKDTTYTIKGLIKPKKGGVYPITVSATSWQHDTNYTNSASDDVTFDKSLKLQPVSQSYIIGNILKFPLILILGAGLILAAIKTVRKYSPAAKKWLTPPT